MQFRTGRFNGLTAKSTTLTAHKTTTLAPPKSKHGNLNDIKDSLVSKVRVSQNYDGVKCGLVERVDVI